MDDQKSLKINVLERIEIIDDSTSNIQSSSKLLLAYLIEPHLLRMLGHDCPISLSRERLCSLVANGKAPTFRVYLGRLRKIFKEAGILDEALVTRGQEISLLLDHIECDAVQFIHLCQANTPESLLEAVNVYRGPLAGELSVKLQSQEILHRMFEKCEQALITRLSDEDGPALYYNAQPKGEKENAPPPDHNNVSAIADQIFDLVRTKDGLEARVDALNLLYQRLYKAGHFNETLKAYNQVILNLDSDTEPEIKIKLFIDASGISLRTGDTDAAAIYLHRASTVKPKEGGLDMTDRLKMAYGHLEYQRGDAKMANRYYVDAYQIVQSHSQPNRLAEIALSVIASISAQVDIYINERDIKKATSCLDLAKPFQEDLQRALNTPGILSLRANDTAGIFARQRAQVNTTKALEYDRYLEKSEKHFRQALALSIQTNDQVFVAICRNNLACIYYDHNDFLRAVIEWEGALETLQEFRSIRLSAVTNVNLGCGYFKLRRYAASCESFVHAIHLYFKGGYLKDVADEALFWIVTMFNEAKAHVPAQQIQALRQVGVPGKNKEYVVNAVEEAFATMTKMT